MWELAAELAPGASTASPTWPSRSTPTTRGAIVGTDALLERLESFTQATVRGARRRPLRHRPVGSAAATPGSRPRARLPRPYYIPPSEDLSRPGTTWFPTLGRDRFPWWRIASTWYHEAVPGHHLQNATSLLAVDRLSRYQRTEAWTSGYGEGWALYAERLMEELGAFTDPGDELGYLEGQGLRAARIVVDLGLHLELRRARRTSASSAGSATARRRPWTPEMAVALLEDRAIQDHEFAVSEVDRYLAHPRPGDLVQGGRAGLARRPARPRANASGAAST